MEYCPVFPTLQHSITPLLQPTVTRSFCLNTITIRFASLEEKIKAAQAAGYQGIGLWSDEIAEFLSREKYYGKLRDALKDAGLAAVELCALGGWMFSEGNTQGRAFDDARRKCEQAAEVGIGCIIACAAGESGELPRAVTTSLRCAKWGASLKRASRWSSWAARRLSKTWRRRGASCSAPTSPTAVCW